MYPNSYWNYRVFRRVLQTDTGRHVEFILIEVYYNGKNSIESWSHPDDPMIPYGESLNELRSDLNYFQAALNKPVLIYNENEDGLVQWDGNE